MAGGIQFLNENSPKARMLDDSAKMLNSGRKENKILSTNYAFHSILGFFDIFCLLWSFLRAKFDLCAKFDCAKF